MKAIYKFMAVVPIVSNLAITGYLLSSEPSPHSYLERPIGILRDATTVPTSFNERPKTQLKTDQQFLVVEGHPQLVFGKEVVARVDGSRLIEIQDVKGAWYRVQ